VLSILIAFYTLYVAFTHASDFAIYPAVWIPVTIICLFLYAIDRVLTKKIPYYKLMLGELVIGILIFVVFSYQDSYTTINFHTDQDYILVIFDDRENSISRFEKKGFFGKELNFYNTNTAHLDRSIGLRKNLRIKPPEEWQGFFYTEGKYASKGDSIKYIYSFKENRDTTRFKSNFIRASESYIDSLLKQEMK